MVRPIKAYRYYYLIHKIRGKENFDDFNGSLLTKDFFESYNYWFEDDYLTWCSTCNKLDCVSIEYYQTNSNIVCIECSINTVKIFTDTTLKDYLTYMFYFKDTINLLDMYADKSDIFEILL